MTLELDIEDPAWEALDLAALAQRAVAATLVHLGLDPELCEIALLACDDTRIAALNADFRDKPTATNVLSWPAEELAAEAPGGIPDLPEPDFTGEIPLGDIAIAYGTCAREATEQGKSLADHCTHLIIHGLLHLLGYDHIRDPDATLMEGLEIEILGSLGLNDPYNASDGP
ncbi:rRNA maturation RNase YbeY [Pseudodonghicola flavimaris]|uniref:Endoribonuclease YbeY n=1 Tax=Pseudodonghicola flavimaris TaxID=3050036 RepID=A0ABT7F360_9RHOB|nr:rRNA maturation RNase YbeY [Pseudodonghicola flavimaris]MDK3019032.1 rRNA maturation RNase YbeY [Pseudodonghicola flavimaris]